MAYQGGDEAVDQNEAVRGDVKLVSADTPRRRFNI